MSWWGDRVVPHLTDVALRSPEIGELREETCRGLHGRVGRQPVLEEVQRGPGPENPSYL